MQLSIIILRIDVHVTDESAQSKQKANDVYVYWYIICVFKDTGHAGVLYQVDTF